MNTAVLKDKICQLATAIGMDLNSTTQSLASLGTIDLFIWLSEQDNSLRYHLALELDIPLQQLEHTCSTLKQIDRLPD